MSTLVVTEELVERMLAIEIANLESRLGPYRQRPGNPAGVVIRKFGRATAFISAVPVRFFNSVFGVGPEVTDDLPGIEAHYRAHGANAAMEIVPGRLTEELALALGARGWVMAEFHAGLARELTEADVIAPPAAEGVVVEEIDPRTSALETFLDTYLVGWGSEPDEETKANMRLWQGNESWRFFLAYCEGQPAGAAILDTRGKTAFLGSAGTRPVFRGRRVQGALLSRRVAEAAGQGCDLLVGGAYFGTTSMRNQQRAGFATAFTRGIWVLTR